MMAHVDEIIKVVVRHRYPIWKDRNIELTEEQAVKEVKEEYLRWAFNTHSKDALSSYNVICKLENLFYRLEIKYSKEQQLCALEYGM